MKTTQPGHKKKGFLLLEAVLGIAIFCMVATGLVVALNRASKLADQSQSELRSTRILETAVQETLSLPTMEVGEFSKQDEDSDVEVFTKIELMDDLLSLEGQPLQEMYRIRVKARWYAGGGWHEREVETWRYGRMYQP